MKGHDSQPGSGPRRAMLDLRFVRLTQVRLHEDFEEGRSAVLCQAVQAQGTLRNPPIVAETEPGQYLHLDGANRLTTLGVLGYTYALVQVVRLEEQSLGLWGHRAHLDDGAMRDVVGRVAGARVVPVAEEAVATVLRAPGAVAAIVRQGGETVVITVAEDATRLALLRQLMALYGSAHTRCVVDPKTLLPSAPDAAAHLDTGVLVPAPAILDGLAALPMQGARLPTGLSRVVLTCGRALGINAPLALLATAYPAAQRQAWLRGRLAQAPLWLPGPVTIPEEHGLRLYAEDIALFDTAMFMPKGA